MEFNIHLLWILLIAIFWVPIYHINHVRRNVHGTLVNHSTTRSSKCIQNPLVIHENNVSSNPFIQSTGFPLIMFPMKMANNMAITGGLFHFQTPHFLEQSPKTISQTNVEHFPRNHGSFPWDENTYDRDILEPYREWVKKMMLPSGYD